MALPIIAGVVAVQAVSAIAQNHQQNQARREQSRIARENLEAQIAASQQQFQELARIGDETAAAQQQETLKTLNAQMQEILRQEGEIDQKLAESEQAWRAIVPPKYDLSPMDPPELIQRTIPPTDFDMSRISPEQIKQVGQFSPTFAKFVGEVQPSKAEESPEAKVGLESQMKALRRLSEIAGEESDPQLAGALQKAAQRAQTEAQSRSESIMQDFARRGQSGAGMQLAQQLQQASAGMETAAQQSQAAAEAQYRNRLQALMGGAELGGAVRGQQMREAEREADIINQFNQRTSQRYQNYLDRIAQMQSEADLANLREAQRISETNLQQQYQSELGERERMDRIAMQQRGEQVSEVDRQNQLAMQQYQMQQQEAQRVAALQQQAYADQLRKMQGLGGVQAQQLGATQALGAQRLGAIGGAGQQMQQALGAKGALMAGAMGGMGAQQQAARAGYGQQMGEAAAQAAAQRQKMTQAAADVATTGMLAYGQEQRAGQAQQAADRRAYFEKYGREPKEGEFGYE